MQPASVFIMDVSNSSTAFSGEELSDYLAEIEGWIKQWFQNSGPIQVKHRSGDELIFLANGFSTAFITAFFVSRLWKFESNQPYFGLAFGSIDKDVKEIDIEKWIHPLVKQARIANDFLKKEQKNRETFLFQLTASGEGEEIGYVIPELEALINGTLRLQHALAVMQTDIQKLVGSLYLIYEKQKAVAELLGRSAPTIYSHYKKGHSEQILGSYREVASVLDSLQAKAFEHADHRRSKLLEEKIRHHVKDHVRNVFNF